ADIYGSLVIEKDNIVVDGANHSLQGQSGTSSKGVDLSGRSNVTITNMKIRDFDYGVFLYSTSYSVLSQNDLTNNNYGVFVEYSTNNTISGNNVKNNEYGGIELSSSNYNSIYGNDITAHGHYGIYVYDSSNNNIAGNNIANNEHGIGLESSSNNSVYHNNFVGNTYQVYDLSWEDTTISGSINVWDDGYPSGGNYWSDYEEIYPDAEELDGSGVWKTLYVIDESNQDNYPLSASARAIPLE
ncbi:MAG TPA: NosD domain-containing protein, partial [Patescibacteria group bacterium]|nr:NosD domain-containing protein [Patescibacteria group bacterium]